MWCALGGAVAMAVAQVPLSPPLPLPPSPAHIPTFFVCAIKNSSTQLWCGCVAIRSSLRFFCFSHAVQWGSCVAPMLILPYSIISTARILSVPAVFRHLGTLGILNIMRDYITLKRQALREYNRSLCLRCLLSWLCSSGGATCYPFSGRTLGHLCVLVVSTVMCAHENSM